MTQPRDFVTVFRENSTPVLAFGPFKFDCLLPVPKNVYDVTDHNIFTLIIENTAQTTRSVH